jgi:hypothetical protein
MFLAASHSRKLRPSTASPGAGWSCAVAYTLNASAYGSQQRESSGCASGRAASGLGWCRTPTYARALLEAMRARGYEGTEQDLGYLLKAAFRAHPAVKKAKRGKKGVRWQGLAVTPRPGR